MSLERGLELKSCPWEGVSWAEEGFEQSLRSVLRAVMSILVCGAEESVSRQNPASLQGAGQMLG